MPLTLYRADANSRKSSPMLPASKAPAKGLRVFLAALLACVPALATAQQRAASSCVNDGVQPQVRVQQRGSLPLHLCEGRALAGASTQVGHGDPLALASADFDEDGVPDLVSGFASGNVGTLTIHRGNIQALWPYGPELVKNPPQPFFPNARTFALPEKPDFLVTGDFDADGHWDILTAQRGSSYLYFLKGDGHGSFLTARKIAVSGNITAMIAGEMNRPDGLADLILAVTSAEGPRALVYESPRGAVYAQPEIFPLAQPATALALGRFDGDGIHSLAIGAGNRLVIVHGRDRKLSVGSAQAEPAVVTQQALPYTVTAIAAGDFTGTGPSLAALGSDSRIHVLEGALAQRLLSDRAAADPNYIPSMQVANAGKDTQALAGTMTPGTAAKLATLRQAGRSTATAWIERNSVELPSGFSQHAPQLLAARVAGSMQENVLALDSGNNQVHVLSTVAPRQGRVAGPQVSSPAVARPMQLLASLQSQSAPAAVLPMRLGSHGLNGLVMLQTGQTSPIVMPQDVPPANVFTVTNTLDITAPHGAAPTGSLREAMNLVEAVSEDNAGGNYEIDFNIPTTDPGYNPSTGTFLIQPLSENVPGSLDYFALPPINATVTIDGYTQPGASPNTLAHGDNAKILIQIDGGKATTPGGSGLVPFDDIGSVFRGLDFTGWLTPSFSTGSNGQQTASGAWGIEANGVGDFIEGNFFGTDPTGKTPAPNLEGIFADNGPLFGSAPGNVIGGTTPQARNILSGNNTAGILLLSTAYEAQLQGNFVGLDPTGSNVVPNTLDGAGFNGPTITIGGTLPGATNYIAGNGTNVDLNDLTEGGAAKNSTVQGNVIGTDATGTSAIAHQGYGVSIQHDVTSMTIGGTTPAARNLISGNYAGVYIFDGSFNNVVQGNYIGTDITGTHAVANLHQGVVTGSSGSTEQAAGNTTIGGTVPGAGNLISGNTTDGISISGISQPYSSSPPLGNTIQGNFIGTNAAGTAALSNGGAGIDLFDSSSNNVIGGSQPGAGNLIAYNSGSGVLIDPATPNSGTGTGNVTIANTILSNDGAGVRVLSGTGNRISQNSIYANQSLGIDIAASGPNTNNHCNTPNTGANNLQNFPVLTPGNGTAFISATATDPSGNTSEFSAAVAATQTGNLLSLLGTFDSTANTTFNLEFFSSPTADGSGYGQGKTYLGSTSVTTGSDCTIAVNDPVDLTQADVSVVLTASNSQFATGPDYGTNTYTGTVTNKGPATAHNVVFVDTLPAELAISSAYCNVASCQSPVVTSLGSCTVSGQKITCNLGTMAPGATASITIPVVAVATGTILNTATVSATEADPNLLNNTSTPSSAAVYPSPYLDHLDPSAALVNSADLPMTIYGESLISSSAVTFNGTAVPVKGFLDNQLCGGPFSPQPCSALQVVIPAALLTTAGTPVVTVTNPDPTYNGNPNYPSTLNFTIAASCTYDVFSFLDGGSVDADGPGLIAANASVNTNAPTCPWTAVSNVSWATILDNASATGSATTDINIAANTGATTRTGTVTVAGQILSFTQAGGSVCPNTLGTPSPSFSAVGGTGTTTVTTDSSCAYFVVPYADWLTVPQTSSLLVGSATATYNVAPNHGAPRTGTIAFGGTTLTVTQQAPACYFTLDTTSALVPVAGTTGTINVTASSPSCAWTATSSNTAQLSVTSGASGTGNGTVKYKLPANTGGPIAPTLTIGNSTGYSIFTATQSSAFTCTFTVSPTPLTVSSEGTSNFFTLTASYGFCKWTAASNDPTALAITQASSGTGSAAVYYSVGKNTGAARTLTITAGCQTFTINQGAPLTTTPNNPVPTITTLAPTSVTAGAGATTLTVNGTNFLSTSVVNFNGTARTTTYVSATKLTIGLLAADVATAGSFTVTVTNPTPGGGTSNSVNFTVNAVVNNPVPTITTLSPTSVTAGTGATTLTINGTNFISTSVVNFNGTARTTTYVSATKLTIGLLAADVATAGSFPVTVTNATPGGGTSNSVSFTVNAPDNPVPTITTLSPTSVTAGAGATTLTINGTNFISTSVVNFNGTAKTTTYVSATKLTIGLLAADVATAGSFPVTVTNPTPGGGTSNSVNFTVNAVVVNNPVPTITTLSPTSVTAGAGATTLTINGTNFLSGSTVSYNGATKTTTYVSPTQLTAALLATDVATAGTFPVTVTNPTPGGGTSNSVNFTVNTAVVNNPTPTITTFSPTSVTAGAGATTLTINGTNFLSTSVVNFNGTAKTTTYVSATQLTAALLATDVATAGTYPVTVNNPTPGGGTSNSVNFTVNTAVVNNPTPTITTLSPTSVTAGAGATTLTINGTNFISGSTVSYNGATKTTTYVSATQLTAALLATDVATAGTYPVTVTNPTPGGGTSNSVNFTVNTAIVPAPAVTFNPTTLTFPATPSGTASAAQVVTLTNTGNATLNLSGITLTGTNAAAFSQTNTCSSTLASTESCAISVVFTPSSVAAFTASLSVADDANASPQTVSLSGSGEAPPSFTVSSTTPAQTVAAGGAAQYTLTVSPQGGSFPGTVTLSATGLPTGATATFTPQTLSPGSTSLSTQLTIQTAATTAAAGLGTGWTLTLASLPIFALLLALRRRRATFTKLTLIVLATLGAATALTGCGGGFSITAASTAKTYNVTITGTSGAEQQSTTVQLTVK